MSTEAKKIEKLQKEVQALRNLVTNLIPYDEEELDPEYRKELQAVAEQEPEEEYQPGQIEA